MLAKLKELLAHGKKLVKAIVNVEEHERLKLFYLTLSFFFIIGAYTLVKDLKDSIFANIVGREYVVMAQWLTMFILIPAILFYSTLVDNIRRYQLLMIYSAIFGVMGLIFAYFLGHPTMGMYNTEQGAWRVFGWIFYFFGEGYSPFVVSVFWAFSNSVNNPEEAKNNYGLLSAGSKLGGMLTSGFAWYLLSPNHRMYSDTVNHQLLLTLASVLLLLVPIIIYFLMKNVPGKYLHGYEAAYKVEKERSKTGQAKTGILPGLMMLFQQPYVFGIFGMVFFYEVVAKVLSYQRLGVAQENSANVSEFSAYLFKITFCMHFFGFLLSFLGTRALLHRFGERICLLLIPIGTGVVLFYFLTSYSPTALLIAVVGTKVINYAFSWPVREGLYVPTTKEIKFKSKSWIDAFGSKFAKSAGSGFNWMTQGVQMGGIFTYILFFFSGVTGLWLLTAYLLGRRFDKAIAQNEIIGIDS